MTQQRVCMWMKSRGNFEHVCVKDLFKAKGAHRKSSLLMFKRRAKVWAPVRGLIVRLIACERCISLWLFIEKAHVSSSRAD